MGLLLDTHALVWLMEADERLSRNALASIERAESVSVSIISFWELAIKANLKKLTLEKSLATYYLVAQELNFRLLKPDLDETEIIAALPPHHRDPFDRMLIAQAMTHRLSIVTKDPFIPLYGVPVLW